MAMGRDRCRHVWLLVIDQGRTILLECEICAAVVAVGWEPAPRGGRVFMFGVPRPADQALVSVSDFRELGEFFAKLEQERVLTPAARRHRRRRPGRAA